jgi:collagenase-like PrtC family protease
MDLTACQIERLIKSGIRSFKISGREMEYEAFENELNNYIKIYEAIS